MAIFSSFVAAKKLASAKKVPEVRKFRYNFKVIEVFGDFACFKSRPLKTSFCGWSFSF